MPRAKATLRRWGALLVLSASAWACSSDEPAAPASSSAGSAGQAGAMLTSGGGAGAASAGTSSTAGQAGASGGQAGTSGGQAGTSGSAGAAGAGGNSGTAGNGGSSGTAGSGGAPGPFELTSPAFEEGGLIDVKFRCTGDNVTPALSWSSGPPGTQSYAVTLIHVGSQSVHWVLWDIPVATRMLAEGVAREAMPAAPAGAKQLKPNIDGSTWYGYTGPCPGSANQSYTFSVYALDVATLPGITPESTSAAANTAVKAHQLAVAQLTGMASK